MSDGYFSTSYWAGQKVATGFSLHVMKTPKRTFEKISIQFSSVAQSCLTLCHPMDYSMPVLFVHHQLLEFTQMHAHWVGDAIRPSHPLLSPFPPALNLSQHQGLFIWVSSLHQVTKVLEFQLQYQSFQWIFRTDYLSDGLGISLQSKGLSRVFSNTTVQKHQFFSSIRLVVIVVLHCWNLSFDIGIHS